VISHHPGLIQRLAGYFLTAAVAAVVILIWMMVMPILRSCVFMGDAFRNHRPGTFGAASKERTLIS